MQGIDVNMCPRGKEREAVKATLRRYLKWHEREELPKYVAALERIAKQVGKEGVTRDTIEMFFGEGESAWKRMMKRAAGPFSKHLARMTPRQLDCMDAQLEKRAGDWRERVQGTDREYRKRWLNRAERFLSLFFEGFDQRQRALMMAEGPIGQALETKMNVHRMSSSSAFADVVRTGNRAKIRKALRAVARNPRFFFSQEGRKVAAEYRKGQVDSLAGLSQHLKPRQVRYMKNKLLTWASGLREIVSTARR